MELLLLRHGLAEDPGPATEHRDEPRALTPKGSMRMRLGASGMRALGVAPDVLVSSPLTRCAQTADIVGDHLGLEPALDDRLRPGMRTDGAAEIIAEHPGVASLMMCGHQPDLSLLAGVLVGGGYIEFRKGTLAILDVTSARAAGASLVALYPPKVLRHLGS